MAENVIEFLIKGDASGGSKAFDKFGGAIDGVTKVLGALGIAIGAVKLVEFVGRQIEVADQMGKMALKAGVAVDSFSQMSHAFALSDVSAEELSGSFKFLNKAIDDAKQGNDAARLSFESVGVSMSNLKNDSPDEVLLKLADAFTKIEDPSARTTMLLEKFGRAGLKLAPAMEEGRAGIEKLMQQADKLGLTVDKEFAAAADRFGDSLQTIGAAADGAGRQLGKTLLPILQETIDALFDFGGTAEESILPWGKITVAVVGSIAAVVLALVSVVKNSVDAVVSSFQAAGNALLDVNDAAVKLLTGEGISSAVSSLEKAWGGMGETASRAVSRIDDDLLKTGAAINKMDEYVQNYGQSVKKAGNETEEASKKPGLNPISKEAATRMETTRKALSAFISDMEKAEASASNNKLALLDAEYNSQVTKLNDLQLTDAQTKAAMFALDNNYAAQRVALNDSMLGQLGIGNEAYRARQAELIVQEAARMELAGVSAIDAQNFIDTSLLSQQAAYLAAKNSAIAEDYKTQDARALSRYEEEVVRLQLARAEESISKVEFDAAMYEAEVTKQASLGNLQKQAELARMQVSKMNLDGQLAYTSQALGSITGLMQTENKKQFAIGKAAAVAQAVINTYNMATSAYKSASAIPIVGWILGPLAAAAAIALGMQNVSKIRSTQMGQAHAGMTNIPAEGSYLLDKGERVIQPEQNRDLTSFLNKGEGGGGGVQVGTLAINITVPSGEALRSMTRSDWEDIASAKIIPALNSLDRKGVRPDSVQRYDR